jgi:hypothetical protein
VLGPRPPPWEKHKIYRKLTIFNDFGAFNRAGKSVSKIGIYALPPLKSEFYTKFIDFLIIRDPILSCYHLFDHYPISSLWLSDFFGPWYCLLWEKNPTVFLFFVGFCWSLGLDSEFFVPTETRQAQEKAPQTRDL